jgi:2-iminoacetate synthase
MNSEYKVDLNNPAIKKKISESKNIYTKFKKDYMKKFDLKNPKSISKAYDEAKKRKIFTKAQNMRELIFGKDMHFYGVVYIWDACVNDCQYCPGSITNRQKALKEGRAYPLRELTVAQTVLDTKAVMKDGHKHVCYLTGSAPGREKLPDKLIPYLIELDKLGLKEIILNTEPPTLEGLKKLRRAVKNTSLQFRVFQETYNKNTYKIMHPRGPKADYNFRINVQARAIEAGFDNVGLGALFGLHRYPLEEIEGIRKHAEHLEKKYKVKPSRICLPSANELANIGVTIPYFLKRGKYSEGRNILLKAGDYEKFDEIIYALARLAMPTINIVSSERDGPAMLRILDKYATCTTLNVHPGVGDNAKIFPGDEE